MQLTKALVSVRPIMLSMGLMECQHWHLTCGLTFYSLMKPQLTFFTEPVLTLAYNDSSGVQINYTLCDSTCDKTVNFVSDSHLLCLDMPTVKNLSYFILHFRFNFGV